MSYKRIDQIKVGEITDGYYLVKSVEIKSTTSNKKYLDFFLCDSSGEINAKLWDYDQADNPFKSNTIIKVRGTIKEWNGKKQFNIERARPASDEDNVKIEDFVPTAPYDSVTLFDQLQSYIEKIDLEDLRTIVSRIIELYKEKIQYYPAAQKNHHSVRSGWLYHVVTMLQTGEKITEVYSFLNRDLLFAGIILHDISKLDEMDANELGFVTAYTVEGQLLGHILQGVKLVDRVARELGSDAEVSLLLQHLIASHHYTVEWGSPKSPMIPEGEILHYLDIIDAHMYDMKTVLDETSAGQITDKVWVLGRRLYRSKQ